MRRALRKNESHTGHFSTSQMSSKAVGEGDARS